MPQKDLSRHVGSAFILMALAGLALGSSNGGGGGGGGQARSSSRPDKLEAWVMAQQFVKDNLKSPGSAEFGSAFGDYQDPDEVVTNLGNKKFRVRAWVDAQNAFGAQIRTHFICELEYVGNERWRLTNLEFLN